MTKLITTYFFSLILLGSIVAPAYMSLVEETCQIEALVDIGEEEENKGKKSPKDLEVKIYYSNNNESLFIDLAKKKRMNFYSKNYTSYYKKLISPPPEHIVL